MNCQYLRLYPRPAAAAAAAADAVAADWSCRFSPLTPEDDVGVEKVAAAS